MIENKLPGRASSCESDRSVHFFSMVLSFHQPCLIFPSGVQVFLGIGCRAIEGRDKQTWDCSIGRRIEDTGQCERSKG